MKPNTAPLQSFSEQAPSFNYCISMNTKVPITPPSQTKAYIHVIVDAFSHFVVTVPIKSNDAKTAVKTLLHHWIVKFGPPIYLVTDRGSGYIITDMASPKFWYLLLNNLQYVSQNESLPITLELLLLT